MAWFLYGDQKRRALRKGVALRVRDLPKEIVDRAWGVMKSAEAISYVIVEELRPEPCVLLAVHVQKPGDLAKGRESVIRFEWDENPAWVCESDIGRGFVRGIG